MRLRSETAEPPPEVARAMEGGSMDGRAERGPRTHRRYHNRSNQAFLTAVDEIVQEHLGDSRFDTAGAAVEMSMSRMHLHRKLRALTGCSTRQYITARRLEVAHTLLARQPFRVRDVAGQVGFRSPSYFARAFARIYGMYPSQYARSGGAWPHAVQGSSEG